TPTRTTLIPTSTAENRRTTATISRGSNTPARVLTPITTSTFPKPSVDRVLDTRQPVVGYGSLPPDNERGDPRPSKPSITSRPNNNNRAGRVSSPLMTLPPASR